MQPVAVDHLCDDLLSIVQHVGSKHYHDYFRLVDFALKSRNATAVVTSSTFPEHRYSGYQCVVFHIQILTCLTKV